MFLEAFQLALKEIKEIISKNNATKQQAFQAAEAVQRAVNETISYLEETRSNGKPNKELRELWSGAAASVRELDYNLWERLLAKAEYWANPQLWSQKQVEEANISLTSLRDDARNMIPPAIRTDCFPTGQKPGKKPIKLPKIKL